MFTHLPFPIRQAAGRAATDWSDPAEPHRRELARLHRAAARARRLARRAQARSILEDLVERLRVPLPAGL